MNAKSLGVAAAMVLPAAAPAEAAVDDERSVVVSLFAATVLSDAARGLGQVNVAGSPPVKAERLSSVRGYSHEPVPAALPLSPPARCVGSTRLAKEAEGASSRLIKAADRISERRPAERW
jgi:hypothetical protein